MPVEATDYAWAAGFLDGEGHLGAVKRSNKKLNDSYNPVISATQSCIDPLLHLQEILGGAVCEPGKTHRPNEARIWKWDICSAARIQEVLPLLMPYMIVKRREAEVLYKLCCLVKPRGVRISPWNRMLRGIYVAELVEVRRSRREENMPCLP